MQVFVLDKDRKPLMPYSPERARLMLKAGRVRIHKLRPFTIFLAENSTRDDTLHAMLLEMEVDG